MMQFNFSRLAIVLVMFGLSASPNMADLPSLRLDGTMGKGSAYRDPYHYTKLDYDAAKANPYKVGIMKRISKKDSEFASLDAALEGLRNWREVDKELREQYVEVVKTEYDLSEKEIKTAKAYPHIFPQEAKTGKRIFTSRVMKLGDSEFSVNSCSFFGKGDWNGDGVPEVFVRHDDGATHAGARSQIRVFSENGDFVCYINMGTIQMGRHRVYDYNNDGKVELVYMPKYKKGEYVILACPAQNEELEPFRMGGNSLFH